MKRRALEGSTFDRDVTARRAMAPRTRNACRLLGLACMVALSTARARADDVAELRAFTRQALSDSGVRGASVALLRNREMAWLEGFGVRDARSGRPVTTRTVFEAASIGKVVAAYGALLRVADGDWSLDMPATSPRLRVRPGCRPPTLGALLSHSAGLGNDLHAARFQAACTTPAPFAYAGQGYLVLQDLFGDASGRAAEAFLHRRIFEPLHMSSATFATPRGSDVATGHVDLLYGVLSGETLRHERAWVAALAILMSAAMLVLARRTWRRRARLRSGALVAGEALALIALGLVLLAVVVVPVGPWSEEILLPSSLHASAEDMARFAAELLEPKLSDQRTRDRLLAARARIDARLAWTPGIGVDRVPTHDGVVTTYWQWGSNPGFQGLLVLVPERGDAIVVLTNTGGFADLLLGDRGGYLFARRLARRALGLDGRWSLRDAR